MRRRYVSQLTPVLLPSFLRFGETTTTILRKGQGVHLERVQRALSTGFALQSLANVINKRKKKKLQYSDPPDCRTMCTRRPTGSDLSMTDCNNYNSDMIMSSVRSALICKSCW